MSNYKYLNFLAEYEQWRGIVKEKNKCTNEEVDEIERSWGIKLPLAYRELFLVSGRSAGFAFHASNDYSFYKFSEMQDAVKEIAAESNVQFLDDKNIFVFAVYDPHGICWFFKLDEGDDPPIYRYEMLSETYTKVADRLTGFIQSQDWYQLYLEKNGRK